MENIDEDIKIVEEMIKRLDKNCFDIYRKAKNTEDYLGTITGKEIISIENLLSRFKTTESEIEFMADFINMYTLSGEENQYCHKVINCEVVGGSKTCIDCIKEWARKKVEDD